MRSIDVIIKPMITEKSLAEVQGGKYTFLVHDKADKNAIKHAIKELYNVDAVAVMTSRTKGTKTIMKRFGRTQRKFVYKKARVVVAEGQKIDAFEEVGK